MRAMVEFKDVCAAYDGGRPVLNDVSFLVGEGEFVAFVGTNGAGKSTTMRLVNGLLKPTAGEVLVEGVSTRELKTSQLARTVGFLFQNPDRQICCNTVREELQFGFRALGILDERANERIEKTIDEFGFKPDADPFLLNRGTRQLLALASVVAIGSRVLVLDEPTTGLDFRECMKVMDVVRRLNEEGAAILMVCHDMEVVADYARRVVVMSGGRVVDDGPTFEVLRRESTLAAASLMPPQAVGISMEVARLRPGLAGSDVARANTLDELTSAVVAGARGGR